MSGPSLEALGIRAHIEAQTCPFCERGPFKMLASHTAQVHGVLAEELREMAHLIKRASICSGEVSSQREDHGHRVAGQYVQGLRWPGGAVTLSAAARETRVAQAIALTQRPDAAENRAKGGRVAAARRQRITDGQVAQIRSRYQRTRDSSRKGGWASNARELAEEFGISVFYVYEIVRGEARQQAAS